MSVVEFVCVDCDIHVSAFGIIEPPSPPRCCICLWLAENVDPSEIPKMRKLLGIEPEGTP